MAYINKHSIETLVQQTTLSEIIGEYVALKRNGSNQKGCCPFHDEKTPSFVVSDAKGIYNCFGCGESGNNAISFIMAKEKVDFIPAVEKLAAMQKFILEYEKMTPEKEAKFKKEKDLKKYSFSLLKNANKLYNQNTGLDFVEEELLNKRKLGTETIQAFRIGYAPNKVDFLAEKILAKGKQAEAIAAGLIKKTPNGTFDYFIDRITFPICNSIGEIVSFGGQNINYAKGDKFPKYINGPETLIYNKSKTLFGLHLAKKAIQKENLAIVTEGYYDVISAHDKQWTNTVGTCGTAFTELHAKELKKHTQNICFAFDGDQAGQKAIINGITIALKEGLNPYCYILPENQDVDDVMRNIGAFPEGKQDAIVWYSNHLVEVYAANGPGAKQYIADKMANILCLIKKDIKRNEYTKLVAKSIDIPLKYLKPMINELVIHHAEVIVQKEAAKTTKAKFGEGIDTQEVYEKGFFEENNRMMVLQGDGGAKEVGNFTMKMLLHLNSDVEDEASQLIAIKNPFGVTHQILMKSEDLATSGTFKKKLSNVRAMWKGNDNDLYLIKDYLMKYEKPASLLKTMGYNEENDCYCRSNGIIDGFDGHVQFKEVDENGLVSTVKNKNVLIPYTTTEFVKQRKNRNFLAFKHNLGKNLPSLSTWQKQYLKVFKDEGIVCLLFNYATVHLDIICDVLENRFPMLACVGKRGSGKGTIVQHTLNFFTKAPIKVNFGAAPTTTGAARIMAQFSNAPIWFDEYKNGTYDKMLKALYDRDTKIIGDKTSGNETKQLEMKGSAIVSGQDIPNSESALLSRFFLLNFFETTHSAAAKAEFEKLEDICENGIEHLLIEIVQHRQHFKKEYKNKHRKNVAEIDKALSNLTEDRYLTNNSVLLTTFDLLLEKGIEFPFNREYLIDLLCNNIRKQSLIDQGNDDISKFWKKVQVLFQRGLLIEKQHFIIADGYLYLSMGITLSIYFEFMAKTDEKHVISEETLRLYLRNDSKIFVKESKKTFKKGQRHNCYVFKYPALNIDLSNNTDEGVEMTISAKSEYKEKYGLEYEEDDDEETNIEDAPF